MTFHKKKWFKYFKNFIIGVGASIVMIGALGKINSEPWGGFMITVGLITEAVLFALLGILPPEKDYYWEKLYPGLDDYHANIASITQGELPDMARPINGEVVEAQLDGMLSELQTLSRSIGSLKALQEVDFSQTSNQLKTMGNFYSRMTEAMTHMHETVEDVKAYRSNISNLNENLTGLNTVYSGVLNSFQAGNFNNKMSESVNSLNETLEGTKQYQSNLASLNRNLNSLNSVYGNILNAYTAPRG